MRNGRPIRFLAVTLGGWAALRAVMLWPGATPLATAAPTRTLQKVVAAVIPPAAASALPTARPTRREASPARTAAARSARTSRHRAGETAPVALASVTHAAAVHPAPTIAPPAADGVIPPPLRPAPLASAGSRFASSAWLLARGGANGTLLGGQLGGSQAGVRLTYALGTARRVALAARVTTPLEGGGRELGLGVEWQPTRIPVRLIAEQRLALDGGRGGPTLMLVGGIGPVEIAPGFRLEAYAQAGAIARSGVEAFGDGAVRLTHPLVRLGGARLDAGAGGWGAGQRGAARVDVGPTLGLVVPVARKALRVTLDWRERVAGQARPGSGPAWTIGSDF